jgi:hypothetical protein
MGKVRSTNGVEDRFGGHRNGVVFGINGFAKQLHSTFTQIEYIREYIRKSSVYSRLIRIQIV